MFTPKADPIDVSFGTYLTKARKAAGYSRTTLYHLTGITHARIKHLEEGDVQVSVRHQEIILISKALKLDADEMLKEALGDESRSSSEGPGLEEY